MRAVAIAIAALAFGACKKSAPASTPSPLGTTGAQIDLPTGWKITDHGMYQDHPYFYVEQPNGEVVWCVGMKAVASPDELAKLEDLCGTMRATGIKSEKLPSGAFHASCGLPMMGAEHQVAATAVGVAGGEMVRCWYTPVAASAAQQAILSSLRPVASQPGSGS